MAEAATEKKEVAEKAKPEPKKVYQVENVVRTVGSRLLRAKSAVRHRFKLFVAGQRLLRGKKLPLTSEQFEANKEEIQKMVMAGQVAVITPDGIRVTALPDGRLIQMRVKDGAVKIVDGPAQVKKAKPVAKDEQPVEKVKTEPEPSKAEMPKPPEEVKTAEIKTSAKAEEKVVEESKKASSKKPESKGRGGK